MNKRFKPPLGEHAPSAALAIENRQLRSQLHELLTQAHNNQRIMHRHHALNLKLIGANGLLALLDAIFDDLKESSSLDAITLMIFDADYEVRRVLAMLNVDATTLPHLLIHQAPDPHGAEPPTVNKPALGPFSLAHHAALFPTHTPSPASVAILPLYRHDHLIGYLNFGSLNPNRFVVNVATDFIEEQAAIIAICLENAINNERLKFMGLTDPLTGINNRRYIESRLVEEIRRAQRHGYALSCMYIDIDHFKQINDVQGHRIGDEVLREVAARIKSELRLSDAFGRFGGEEFIVLLNDSQAEGAKLVANRICDSIAEQPFMLSNGDSRNVTVSIGVATLSAHTQNQPIGLIAQDFVGRADRALYQAKNGGRNRVVCAA